MFSLPALLDDCLFLVADQNATTRNPDEDFHPAILGVGVGGEAMLWIGHDG